MLLSGLAVAALAVSQPWLAAPPSVTISTGTADRFGDVMACQHDWLLNGAFMVEPAGVSGGVSGASRLRQQLAADLGALMPLQQQLSEQPAGQSPDEVMKWAGVRQMVLEDRARLKGGSSLATPIRRPPAVSPLTLVSC